VAKKDEHRGRQTTRAAGHEGVADPDVAPTDLPDPGSVEPPSPPPAAGETTLVHAVEAPPAPFAFPMGAEKEQGELNRYHDLGLLGVGGMGEVRRVYDPTLKRAVAMKTPHPRLVENKRFVSRFIEEAQIGAQLQHPNIITVYGLGELPDGRPYFTMHEMEGTEFTAKLQAVHRASLALLLAQQDKLEEAQTLLDVGEAQVLPHPEEHANAIRGRFSCSQGRPRMPRSWGSPRAVRSRRRSPR